MKRALALVLAFALTLLTFGARANTLRPPSGFDGKMWDSTLALYGTMGDTTRFLCTAEVIEKVKDGSYILLSAGHCVQTIPAGIQFSVSDEMGGQRTPVKMLKAFEGNGLDFSEFELLTQHKYFVMELGNDNDLRIGDAVLDVNFSAGLAKQISLGLIASEAVPASGQCHDFECVGDFLVQMYGTAGASGSAVVSEKTHKIIGIAIWQAGSSIGLGVEPIDRFCAFLAGPNQPHPSEDDQQ